MVKQIKILKSNLSSFKEALKDVYKVSEEDNHNEEIDRLNSQIDELRERYDSIKEYQDDYFIAIKNDIITRINALVEQRASYQSNITTQEEYDEIVRDILSKVKDFPDEFDDIGNTNYRSILSNGVIVNKGLVYFIIGNPNLKLPLNPKLLFKSAIEYKVRLTTFTTQFGVLISK